MSDFGLTTVILATIAKSVSAKVVNYVLFYPK
jgi:hypothetical protein